MIKLIATILLLQLSFCGMAQLKESSKSRSSMQPETVAVNYINWYLKNMQRLNRIEFLTGGPIEDYAVNFIVAEYYFRELKKSGYVSEGYINNFRNYFKYYDEHLKKHPQRDGPAFGFDFDLVLQAQDYMEIEEGIDKAKIISKRVYPSAAIIKFRVSSVTEMFFF